METVARAINMIPNRSITSTARSLGYPWSRGAILTPRWRVWIHGGEAAPESLVRRGAKQRERLRYSLPLNCTSFSHLHPLS